MQEISYRIFYDYEAMQKDNHLHNKLTEQNIKNNISSLPSELETMLSDKEATVSLGKSTKDEDVIFVKSNHNENVIDEIVIKALQGLSLFGSKLESISGIK